MMFIVVDSDAFHATNENATSRVSSSHRGFKDQRQGHVRISSSVVVVVIFVASSYPSQVPRTSSSSRSITRGTRRGTMVVVVIVVVGTKKFNIRQAIGIQRRMVRRRIGGGIIIIISSTTTTHNVQCDTKEQANGRLGIAGRVCRRRRRRRC